MINETSGVKEYFLNEKKYLRVYRIGIAIGIIVSLLYTLFGVW